MSGMAARLADGKGGGILRVQIVVIVVCLKRIQGNGYNQFLITLSSHGSYIAAGTRQLYFSLGKS